jgi:hypothetical protein
MSKPNKIVATKVTKSSDGSDILNIQKSLVESVKHETDRRLSSECGCNKPSCAIGYTMPFKKLHGVGINASINFSRYTRRVSFSICADFIYSGDSCDEVVLFTTDIINDNQEVGPLNTHAFGCRHGPQTPAPELKLTTYSLEDYTKILEKVRHIIISLEFDKQAGRFRPATEKPTHDLAGWAAFAELCPTLELSYDKCCVCHEHTMTRTDCNHNLCYVCWSAIKPTSDADRYDDLCRHCPLCRCDISLIDVE